MVSREPSALDSLDGTRSRLYHADCVTILLAAREVQIQDAMVYVDREAALVHVLDESGSAHLVTAPLGRTVIEWRNTSPRGIEPTPRGNPVLSDPPTPRAALG